MSPTTSARAESSRIEIALTQTPQVLLNSCTIHPTLADRSIPSARGESYIHDHDPSVHHYGTRLVETHSLLLTRADCTGIHSFSRAGGRWDHRDRQLGPHHAVRDETGTRPGAGADSERVSRRRPRASAQNGGVHGADLDDRAQVATPGSQGARRRGHRSGSPASGSADEATGGNDRRDEPGRYKKRTRTADPAQERQTRGE